MSVSATGGCALGLTMNRSRAAAGLRCESGDTVWRPSGDPPSPSGRSAAAAPSMRTPFAICLAATALVAQSAPLPDEPRLSRPLEPFAAAQLAGSDAIALSALGDKLASADAVVVHSRQQNQQPVVKAGPDAAIVITSAAHLAGAAEDDGLPGRMLVVHWNLLAGPGTANFTAPTQPVTDVTFSVAGSYTLELSAFDGEFTSTDTVVVTVQDLPVTLELAIATGTDDAEQEPMKVERSSKSIEMGDGTVNQVVGLRFHGVAIPRGAAISSAHVQFTTDMISSIPTQLRISGEASDDAAPFQSRSNNISGRPATKADVSWAPAAWRVRQEAGPNQRTPNLKSIVQEITSRPGWKDGNSMVLKITGTGSRTATSFEKRPAGAARLIVTYHP